ncbi:SIMPL domain-containing protein [Thalassotalea ponticola]|uniref:SIMPL domain-containing protein n=1 Tax=Thalassotalea ponticola TaxID=1523392 RepID=UPI0025B5EC57|nr:SIMPL domain-containing protein [Thalassotalea ponticola]MDN3651321.1 SIMPL domain-containing protein [Thalassotalea ponticola]
MQKKDTVSSFILGSGILLGLALLGYLLANAAIKVKQYERSVVVKGLAEREQQANVVIWPIQFSQAANDVQALYQVIEENTDKIKAFLLMNGIQSSEMSVAVPEITDKLAQQYGNPGKTQFRYTGMQTVTVYSDKIDTVRSVVSKVSSLGKQGIVLSGANYQAQIEYIFTDLNEIKPSMIEEATRNAREVAQKFASDSNSQLGKIKRASQGQFTISNRDKNNPHIKKIRVVSTIEYYLSD